MQQESVCGSGRTGSSSTGCRCLPGGRGFKLQKMLSMEWVIQRTGPTERLGCFVPKRTVVIVLFQLILVACDRPNLEGWDHFTRSWHWCQWGVGAVNWNVCVVPVSFESNCEKADRQLLLESESSDKLAGPAWKSKNYHLACLGLSCSWPRVVCYCYRAVLFRYFWLLASIILWSILITWNPCAEFGWEFYGATWSHRDRADQQDGT